MRFRSFSCEFSENISMSYLHISYADGTSLQKIDVSHVLKQISDLQMVEQSLVSSFSNNNVVILLNN